MSSANVTFKKPYMVSQGRVEGRETKSYQNKNGISEDRLIQAESDVDDAVLDGADTFVRETELKQGKHDIRRYWVDDRDEVPNLRLSLRRNESNGATLIVENRTQGGGSVVELPAGDSLEKAKKLLGEALEEVDLDLSKTSYSHPDARVSRVLLLQKNDELSHIQLVRSVPYPYLDYTSDQPIDRKDPKVQQHDFATMKYGFPGIQHPLFRNRTVVSYNTQHKSANWVAERVNRFTLAEDADVDRKKAGFKNESVDDIAPEHQAKLKDYKGSGFDRGHLAPAANHKSTQEDMQETFLLANISPQVGSGFNQRFWRGLESKVREWGSGDEEVYVVTGPAYLSDSGKRRKKREVSYQVIGENEVSVPTHFYKVMLAERPTEEGGVEIRTQAFLVPNKEIEKETPMESYLVSIDDLEKKTGLDFFNRLPDGLENELEAETPQKVWGDGAEGWHIVPGSAVA